VSECWWLGEEGEALLASLGLAGGTELAAAAARGRVVSTGRQAAAVVLCGEPPLLVKWRRSRPGKRWRTFLRPSPERLEARVALRAAALGIAMPIPLAVVETRRCGMLEGAVLVRRYLPDGRTAAEAFRDVTWREAFHIAARALKEWHGLGFRHGDCWPRNLLLARESVPIGCSRARFVRGGERRDRRRIDDCARLLLGLVRLQPRAVGLEAELLPAYGDDSALLRAVVKRKAHLAARLGSVSGDRPPQVPPFPRLRGMSGVRVVGLRKDARPRRQGRRR